MLSREVANRAANDFEMALYVSGAPDSGLNYTEPSSILDYFLLLFPPTFFRLKDFTGSVSRRAV